jgi:hypothetical protein
VPVGGAPPEKRAVSDAAFEEALSFLLIGDPLHADQMFRESTFFYMFD